MTFAEYHQLARSRFENRALWRLFLGMGIIGVGYLLSNIAFLLPVLSDDELARMSSADATSTPRLTLLVLVPFAGVVLSCFLVVRFLHKTPLTNLFSLRISPFLKAFLTGAVLAIAVYLILLLVLPSSTSALLNLEFPEWSKFLIPAIVLIAIQTLSEELVFRGYLQPLLAARFRSPLIWWFLPAFTFGALHWQQESFAENAPLVVLSAVLMGLLLGDITARTGSIALAWGIHFANNCFALLAVALPGPLSGLALYLVDVNLQDSTAMSSILTGNVMTLVTIYAIYLIWLRFRRKSPGSFAIFG